MHYFHNVLALVALAAAGAAQVTIEGEALTQLGVYAETSPTSFTFKSIAKGTRFTTAMAVEAKSGVNSAALKSTIASGVATAILSGKVNTSNGTTAYARGTTVPNYPYDGSPKLGFRFRSATRVKGRIVVTLTPNAYSTWYSSAYTSVRVKATGHDETGTTSTWALPLTKEFAVELDSAGVLLEVSLRTLLYSNYGANQGDMKVEARFVPGHQVSAFGTSCAHVHTAFPDPSTIEFHLGTSQPNARAFLLAGLHRIEVTVEPIAWGCRILVDPLVVIAGPRTDSWGRATLKMSLPNADFRVLVQGAAPGKIVDQFTNGLDVTIHKR